MLNNTKNKKPASKAMSYETTGELKPMKAGIKTINEMSSARILLHLVSRHKLSLWQLYAVALTGLLVYFVIFK